MRDFFHGQRAPAQIVQGGVAADIAFYLFERVAFRAQAPAQGLRMQFQARGHVLELGELHQVAAQLLAHPRGPTEFEAGGQHQQHGVAQVAAQGLGGLGDGFVEQRGGDTQHRGRLGKAHGVAHKHQPIVRGPGAARVGEAHRAQGNLLLHQPAGKAMGEQKAEFGEVGAALGDGCSERDSGFVVVLFELRGQAAVDHLEEAAVAVQRLAQGLAGDHRVAHHVPTAQGQGARGIAQRLVAHGPHRAGLQIGKLLDADARLAFVQQARRYAVAAQQIHRVQARADRVFEHRFDKVHRHGNLARGGRCHLQSISLCRVVIVAVAGPYHTALPLCP